MRNDIYYWKCDNPLPLEKKLLYTDKYALSDISNMVALIAEDYFKETPVEIENNGSKGNHYTYIITFSNKKVFFRADDGQTDDDYLDAENAVMNIASIYGVPVPKVYYADTSLKKYPVRYQLMEMISGKPLNVYHQEGVLDKNIIGKELGRCMAKLHQVHFNGYGFINTEKLKSKNIITGLDKSHSDYFYKKLDYHIKYLRENNFLTSEKADLIKLLIKKNEHLLSLKHGSLIHKDLAFWNMIGSPSKLNAIVDWDDVIIGDPVDDLSITRCFYNEDIFNPILEGYREISPLPDDFYPKLWFFLIRNMLWKAVIRIFMNYFEIKNDLFILHDDQKGSLRQFTIDRIDLAIKELKKY